MASELINHLWQSTLFAVVAGLATIAFRNNRAHVRYWLWLSASLKFLLPFSLLMGIGSRMEWAPVTHTIAAMPAVSFTVAQMSRPFVDPLPLPHSTRGAFDWAALAIFSVWASGFAVIVLTRVRGWLRIHAAVRASTPISLSVTMDVRSAPGLLEPGVVGVLRPVLLLPSGIVERLKPRQLEAVLSHELCHVGRRDNLTASMHMIVEAVFWFYPLVWWIGARLIEERERACDEAVLSLGTEPQDYAETILSICKSYLESPLSCVAGVTGSNTRKRIEAILSGRVTCDLSFARKLALAVAGAAALAVPIVVGIVNAPSIEAQTKGASVPKFEEASVKSCEAFRRSTIEEDSTPGRLRSQCTTLERLIQQSYGLFATGHMNPGSSLAVIGGPEWTKSDLYEIDARAKGLQSRSMMNGPMLQALLGQRFKLKLHRETRNVPVYALRVARGGPKLQAFEGSCTPRDFDRPPSDADCGTAGGYGSNLHMKAATMADLCAGFSVLLDRQVLNETGIAGRFDMHLDLSEENGALMNRPRSLPALSNAMVSAPPPLMFSPVQTAFGRLGLNLEPTTGPGDFLVVDQVVRP